VSWPRRGTFAEPRYFTFLDECKSPKACTILLRGPSKDILNEIDRNLADAMSVARNVVFNPILAPGGGATEMAISVALGEKAKMLPGVAGAPYKAIADALEVIPRTLVQNCGGNAIRTLTELRAKHAEGLNTFGVDGDTGKVVDMKVYGLLESASVKIQTLKTAIEVRGAITTRCAIRPVLMDCRALRCCSASTISSRLGDPRREEAAGCRRWAGRWARTPRRGNNQRCEAVACIALCRSDTEAVCR
jgi:hypothetical protein